MITDVAEAFPWEKQRSQMSQKWGSQLPPESAGSQQSGLLSPRPEVRDHIFQECVTFPSRIFYPGWGMGMKWIRYLYGDV